MFGCWDVWMFDWGAHLHTSTPPHILTSPHPHIVLRLLRPRKHLVQLSLADLLRCKVHRALIPHLACGSAHKPQCRTSETATYAYPGNPHLEQLIDVEASATPAHHDIDRRSGLSHQDPNRLHIAHPAGIDTVGAG